VTYSYSRREISSLLKQSIYERHGRALCDARYRSDAMAEGSLVDLRSRVHDGGASDFTYKTALFLAVFSCDLAFVIVIFSL
jgi:hypothetical protein